MKISVIVPVYNCAPYVERCVRSIMSQTHDDLEIICVDDGSTDDSGLILDQLACEDARIQVIHQDNAGVSAARNAGIDAASGEFITFVDSDDAIEPDMYDTLIPFFKDENVDIVHCGYKRIHPDGSVKDVNGTGKMVRQNRFEAVECLLAGRLFVGSLCNKVYRSCLFEDVRLDTSLAINEDILANAEVFFRANELVYLDIGKYLMYERKGSATSGTKQHRIRTDCVNAAEKMLCKYQGTAVELSAEERVLNTRIELYRWCIMNELNTSRQERIELAGKIDDIIRKRKIIPLRQRVNYALMRCAPRVYKATYMIYDKVRKPNWDVS